MSNSIVCPVCGAKFEMNIQNTNDITPMVIERKPSKTMLRLEALKQYGVDTSMYSIIDTCEGSSFLSKTNEDGTHEIISDDFINELEKSVFESGFIKNNTLFPRWMMSQYFRWTERYGSITNAVNSKGYEYSWKRILTELNTIVRYIRHDDMNSVAERTNWFTKELIMEMASHYMNVVLDEQVERIAKKCKSKRKEYTIKGYGRLHVYDIKRIVTSRLSEYFDKIADARTYNELYNAVIYFDNNRIKMSARYKFDMAKCFMNAYKGSGAYHILKNLIRFHGVRIKDGDKWMNLYMSLRHVDEKAIEYKSCGYKLLGLMKDIINYNDFDFEKRMNEICK